jgi:hypothetical protein
VINAEISSPPPQRSPPASKFSKYNLNKLREMATSRGIVTTERMKKVDIIALLEN